MSRTARVPALLAALVTLWPMVYALWFLVAAYGFGQFTDQGEEPLFAAPVGSTAIHNVTIAVLIVLPVAYTIHILMNRKLDLMAKLMWVACVLCGSWAGCFSYWWHHIWKLPGVQGPFVRASSM